MSLLEEGESDTGSPDQRKKKREAESFYPRGLEVRLGDRDGETRVPNLRC